MKRIKMICGAIALAFLVQVAFGQKIDDLRMERDIEVAENILSTLIKQQLDQNRMFYAMEVKGYYQPGYGVTFRLPADYSSPYLFNLKNGENVTVWNGGDSWNTSTVYVPAPDRESGDDVRVAPGSPQKTPKAATSLKDNAREKEKNRRKLDIDSAKNAYNAKLIEAAKSFIVDYGDLISQLSPTERIIVTNQGDRSNRVWLGSFFNNSQRTHLSVEGSKGDVVAYKQGKATREQALAKVKVVNTEASDKMEPDMETLSTIFNRLYRSDLSKTYFIEENIYYERLNDFGAIFYMQVYSSIPSDYQRFTMPTLGLEDIDQATREKKVKEIYPQFEQELKENMLEYGRTVRSLKDEESLIINVTLTKCVGCGIPISLELTAKNTVLKDYSAGKIDKATALGKIAIKKGANQ